MNTIHRQRVECDSIRVRFPSVEWIPILTGIPVIPTVVLMVEPRSEYRHPQRASYYYKASGNYISMLASIWYVDCEWLCNHTSAGREEGTGDLEWCEKTKQSSQVPVAA